MSKSFIGPHINPFVLAFRLGSLPTDEQSERRAIMSWPESQRNIERKRKLTKKTDRDLLDWSKAVKERDKNKCKQCGSNDRLHSHHIKPKSMYPDLKYDISNGVTLCAECHAKEHAGNLAYGIRVFLKKK